MPKEDKNILKYSHGEKSLKIPIIICVDIEPLLEKIDPCHSNPKKSPTTKINKHTDSGYSLFLYCSFNDIKKIMIITEVEIYKSSEALENNATKIINNEKNNVINKWRKTIKSWQNICYICKKEFSTNNEKYYKVKYHCHYTEKYEAAAHKICNLRYKIPMEISVVFHNVSKYDSHFVIKDLAEELHDHFND